MRYLDVQGIPDSARQVFLTLTDVRTRELLKFGAFDEFIDNEAFVFLPVVFASPSNNARSEIISDELDQIGAPGRFDDGVELAGSDVRWGARIRIDGS